MKKQRRSTFYRQTVSISMDLKRRMEKVSEPVNWSAEAAKAFKAKLDEIAAKNEKRVARCDLAPVPGFCCNQLDMSGFWEAKTDELFG